jgi:hypothetical protein
MALGTSADDRRLGIALHQIRWVREQDVIDIPIDARDFVDGFYEVETWQPDDHPARWTTGDAGMPPEHVPSWRGPADLHIALSLWEGSVVDPSASAEYAVLSTLPPSSIACISLNVGSPIDTPFGGRSATQVCLQTISHPGVAPRILRFD